MKYAFHDNKKRLLVSLVTKSLTTEANFGAARKYSSKTSRDGEKDEFKMCLIFFTDFPESS